MKKIILPNNTFGALVMLTLLVLLFFVPFTITLWLVGLIAPLWVAGPLAFAVAVIIFFRAAKFKS